MKHTVLLADDHALLRRGLVDLLRYEDDLEVVGEASDGASAVRLAAKLRPDVVVMDLVMPVMDGVEATQRVREASPSTRVLILTSFGTSADVARAVAAGASGAVMKDASTDEQLEAIRTVADGGTALSPEIERTLKDEPAPPFLTERQKHVLLSVTRGLTNHDIATELGVSQDAVKHHLNAICSKLGAANRAEAVAIALRKHLLKI